VTPIRPQLPQTVTTPKPAADARSAFFQSVRGVAASPAPTPAQTRPQPPALATVRVQSQAEPPTRHLRPGSLLDIKV
jgi:hypothetical protein